MCARQSRVAEERGKVVLYEKSHSVFTEIFLRATTFKYELEI